MFKLIDYIQGRFIVFALFLVGCAVFQSYEANKLIKRINEENSSDYRKPSYALAPFIELIIVVILLLLCLIIPINPD